MSTLSPDVISATIKLDYIPREQRKTILLLSDDCRLHSGVGTISRDIIQKTAHHFNWVQVGAALTHPDLGKVFDLSAETNKLLSINDAYVRLYPNNGYGDPNLIRHLIATEKPDAIMHFTDPRYWIWLYQMAHEIRTQHKIPLIYYTIWDNLPYPFYNKPFYLSCDALFCISKQTENIVNNVLGEDKGSRLVTYIPHGVDSNMFRPLSKTDEILKQFKKKIFGDKEYKFVVLYNNRNIRRKSPSDLLLAFARLPREIRDQSILIMKTHPIDENGTNLFEVAKVVDPTMNVVWISDPLSTEDMNLLYNCADVTVNIASNEGWGLSSTESAMAGTMIINNVTGGLQDQCKFEDENGNWIEFTTKFPSNHTGKYRKHGAWCIPIFPSNRSIQGSPLTPYIFDDRVNPEDVTDALSRAFYLKSSDPEKFEKDSLLGREWMKSTQANMESSLMANNIRLYISKLLSTWKSPDRFETFSVNLNTTPTQVSNGIL